MCHRHRANQCSVAPFVYDNDTALFICQQSNSSIVSFSSSSPLYHRPKPPPSWFDIRAATPMATLTPKASAELAELERHGHFDNFFKRGKQNLQCANLIGLSAFTTLLLLCHPPCWMPTSPSSSLEVSCYRSLGYAANKNTLRQLLERNKVPPGYGGPGIIMIQSLKAWEPGCGGLVS